MTRVRLRAIAACRSGAAARDRRCSPVIALPGSTRARRRLATRARARDVAGVHLLCDVRLAGEQLGVAFAFANAGAAHAVHRRSRDRRIADEPRSLAHPTALGRGDARSRARRRDAVCAAGRRACCAARSASRCWPTSRVTRCRRRPSRTWPTSSRWTAARRATYAHDRSRMPSARAATASTCSSRQRDRGVALVVRASRRTARRATRLRPAPRAPGGRRQRMHRRDRGRTGRAAAQDAPRDLWAQDGRRRREHAHDLDERPRDVVVVRGDREHAVHVAPDDAVGQRGAALDVGHLEVRAAGELPGVVDRAACGLEEALGEPAVAVAQAVLRARRLRAPRPPCPDRRSG